MRKCYKCGTTEGLHRHHVFFSANRKISEKYGFVEDLCHSHHTGDKGVHFDREFDLQLKRKHQLIFELDKMSDGISRDEARKEWLSIVGRNYLED